ncbi:MAG: VWA domain-containing protein, partial [Lentisphaerae bacterium]|nr:VWA domain-containing protein [Lentisphaerota bacterium]
MARHAPQPRRLRRLALLLAAALAACLSRAADYVPDGESGGFIRLAAGECDSADAFTVSLAKGDAPAAAAIRPQTLFARRDGGGWILYAGGWPEDLDGTYDLLVRCGEAADARLVRLPGVLHRRTRRMDVALLLDDSHSMRTTDPQRLRVAAARLFAQMAGLRGHIETLTLVAFNRRARLLLPPTPPGDTAAVDAALARLDASGATDLDSAFALAYAELDRLPPSRKIAVVLSDGRDEPGSYTFGHRRFAARQWPVHTIGLSDDIDEEALRMIAASTGGAYHRARNTEALARIFRDLAAALQASVTVGEWNLKGGGEAAFPVDDTLRLLSLALLDRADTPSACALQSPDGKAHALSSAWAADAFADLFAPAAGQWKVQSISGEALLSVTGSSSLELVPFPVTRPAEAGKPVPVAAFVLDGNRLIQLPEIVAQLPDGIAVTLCDDGLNADGTAGDGIFGAYLTLKDPEQTRLAFSATGQTAAGLPFQRLAYRDL